MEQLLFCDDDVRVINMHREQEMAQTFEKLLPETGVSLSRVRVEKDGVLGGSVRRAGDQNSSKDSLLTVLDVADAVFASFVVAPLVVAVWRGCWDLMDLNAKYFPFWQSYVFGITIHVCFALLRSYLLARSAGAWSGRKGGSVRWTRERMLSRFYTVVFMISCILHWRGGWGVLDSAIAAVVDIDDPRRGFVLVAVTSFLVCCASLLRAQRNLLAPPYFVVTDGKEPTYIFATRFKRPSGRDTALYVLDCVFSVAVVGSLVVFVWRGLWSILDIYLYPDDQITSLWASLIIGYVLVAITFALQAPMRWACSRLHGAPRLLLADVFHFFGFLATVNVWRAIWGLLEIYFLPDNPRLSNWVTHTTSLTLLMLLNCSNSVLVRGVYIDAEEPAGECVVFPCHYLRLFFHRERTKKRHRRALLAAAAAAARKSEDAAASAPLAPLTSMALLAQEKV